VGEKQNSHFSSRLTLFEVDFQGSRRGALLRRVHPESRTVAAKMKGCALLVVFEKCAANRLHHEFLIFTSVHQRCRGSCRSSVSQWNAHVSKSARRGAPPVVSLSTFKDRTLYARNVGHPPPGLRAGGMAVASYRYRSQRSDEPLARSWWSWREETTLRVSAAAYFAGPRGRACEPQASTSRVSGAGLMIRRKKRKHCVREHGENSGVGGATATSRKAREVGHPRF